VVEFNRHFKKEEQDATLKETFKQAEIMPGIFMWLIRGYRKYQRQKLQMSVDMWRVIKQYEKDNDLVLQFLEERCVQDESASVKLKTLYDQYKIWSKANGFYECSSIKFAANLNAHPEWFVRKGTLDGYPTYYGLKLEEMIT
ncbi:MAG: primase-like DNA-binding domain-containing protein, partial [Clostridia bacterium]|nr:primase-like DNA-binding domain-containing protein [Clostridia bacterium]